MSKDMILILDLGGSQCMSAARKVRGEGVYCEILPSHVPVEALRSKKPRGLILVGAPREDASGEPALSREVFHLGVPVLCVGYAARRMNAILGGECRDTALSLQTAEVTFEPCALFEGLTRCERYVSRMDNIRPFPGGRVLATTPEGVAAAFGDEERQIYGMQFSAEQNDPDGLTILSNFCRGICGCEPWWNAQTYLDEELIRIQQAVGEEGSALMAISGGVDSTVCAALIHRAIGDRLHCLFVDTGLMRKGEPERVRAMFEAMRMPVEIVDARSRFLSALSSVTEGRDKRRIIDEVFVEVFEQEAARFPQADCLVQGTIYPDVIGSFGAPRIGVGVPAHGRFRVVLEPTRTLFKDEVRLMGELMGIPGEIIDRQPFPGPGLAVRCMGEVTEEKLAALRLADAIFREEIASAGLEKRLGQYFAVLMNAGVQKEYTVALRCVSAADAVSASAYRLPYDLLERVMVRITSEVPSVSRVVYDITSKPPASIEWE